MKRLVFCFDGTWNRLDAPYPTNVVLTAESVIPIASTGVAQSIYYDEGVGTGGRLDKLTGGMFGAGMVKNLGDAYRFLIFNYTPGDEIYVFGFSRGAYTARSFAGMLSTCGILRRRDAAKATEAVERYQSRETSDEFLEGMHCFRRDYAPHVVVSDDEDAWRSRNVPEYKSGDAHQLRITYLGVWDTVGALGVPTRYKPLSFFNKQHEFHDTSLSSFVRSARHAVAIDERRADFAPALWDNIKELNEGLNAHLDAVDAPYQQKWFPGTHGSVGGGGERRGLSDQALDWVLDGSRKMGLELDAARHSRIFELKPNYRESLANTAEEAGLMDMIMRKKDRFPGPQHLYEVSVSGRNRVLTDGQLLADRVAYRPPTLAGVLPQIEALADVRMRVNIDSELTRVGEEFDLYEVKLDETLSAIAYAKFGDASKWPQIFEANADKLENPDRIYVGQLLRIPKRLPISDMGG